MVKELESITPPSPSDNNRIGIQESHPREGREISYSICITHYNNGPTIRASLNSILSQIDERFEVVVVDQTSTDGSREILEEYEETGRIRLFHQSIRNRGAGRQLAFLQSRGEYIVSNMDMDDTFVPFLDGLMDLYHSSFEGSVLRVKRSNGDFCGVTIFPRTVLDEVKGWRDLNWFEDIDIWNRCKAVAPFVEVSFPVFMSRHRRNYTGLGRAKHSYLAFREGLRIGMSRKVTVFNWPLFVLAWISVHLSY